MDSSFLLNDPELIELTGYQKPACQLRILKTMGINAQKNARGKVVVVRKHAEAVLSGSVEAVNQASTPDFSWMEV